MGGCMRTCLVPAVEGFRASPVSYYASSIPGGPPGTSSMTFFCLVYPTSDFVSTRGYFMRAALSGGVSGWGFYISAGNPKAIVYNSTPAAVSVSTLNGFPAYEGLRVPYLLLASYQQVVGVATLTFWMNGVLVGVTAVGSGYTAFAGATTIGSRSNVVAPATEEAISDCGMLDGYDVGTYVDSVFGNGGPGLSARWLADLREGRYLTWPRVAAINADWYWAGRDVVSGPGTLVSWTDRYTSSVLTKGGQPQGASFPARP